MRKISQKAIDRYRVNTFKTAPGKRIKSKNQAIEFVNQRGFIYFWPIKGITLPSLWASVAGDRPVADAHNDPGHVTWGWKDSLLGSDKWYYAKVLRKKSTIISFEIAPYFYALTENYGSPDDDYLTQYEQGKMTQEAKAVYEALLKDGPLDTITLRKSAHLTRRESDARFNRALTDLQADFKICPIGISEAGAWRYAFIYEIVPRQYPQIPDKARYILENSARRHLCELYFRSVGVAQLNDVIKLFHWRKIDAIKAVKELADEEIVFQNYQVNGGMDSWIVYFQLLQN